MPALPFTPKYRGAERAGLPKANTLPTMTMISRRTKRFNVDFIIKKFNDPFTKTVKKRYLPVLDVNSWLKIKK